VSVWVEWGDGLAGLCALRAGSVDLVLSDLPSGETRAEFDRPPRFAAMWAAFWHALRPDGAAVLMASNLRFAAALLGSQERHFRYDLVWKKSLAVGFLNARHRPLRSHEFVLVFSRAAGTYNPQRTTGHEAIHANGARKGHGSVNYNRESAGGRSRGMARAGATDRYPRSVLEFGSVGTSDRSRVHPQQKPEDLLRWCVRTYSRPGELVVDPYAGSGSTGRAAAAEGRRFLGWDTDPRFGVDPLS
jgi:DNA methylase